MDLVEVKDVLGGDANFTAPKVEVEERLLASFATLIEAADADTAQEMRQAIANWPNFESYLGIEVRYLAP